MYLKKRQWGNKRCNECGGIIEIVVLSSGFDIRVCSRCGIVHEWWAQQEWIRRKVLEGVEDRKKKKMG